MQILPRKLIVETIPKQGRVFVQGAAATPLAILGEMETQADRFNNLEIMHLHTMGPARYATSQFEKKFKVTNFFVGANIRPHLDYDRVDYLPCFLSAIPGLLARERKPMMTIIQVSPPDASGVCSLGTSVDVTRDAMRSSEKVIAQINPNVPFTFGDGVVNVSEIDFAVEDDTPLCETAPERLGEDESKIGRYISSLVEDGATLQIGIGSIPNAVLLELKGHKNLGVHTEMFSDGLIDLIESGAITNNQKIVQGGRTVTSFVSGSKKLFNFVSKNKEVVFLSSSLVNDPHVIARNPKVVAVNSAIEVDLTGQVCADSIGPKVISGIGGQLDFIRGAAASPGGKSIIALRSMTKLGDSRVVLRLKPGAGVVTTRGDVDFIVTEYGIAHLKGKSLGERARALIKIAHPTVREDLELQWRRAFTSNRTGVH